MHFIFICQYKNYLKIKECLASFNFNFNYNKFEKNIRKIEDLKSFNRNMQIFFLHHYCCCSKKNKKIITIILKKEEQI